MIQDMDYLSIAQATEILHVSRQSVWSRVKRGIIKADRIGYYYCIERAEVERIAKERSAYEEARLAK